MQNASDAAAANSDAVPPPSHPNSNIRLRRATDEDTENNNNEALSAIQPDNMNRFVETYPASGCAGEVLQQGLKPGLIEKKEKGKGHGNHLRAKVNGHWQAG